MDNKDHSYEVLYLVGLSTNFTSQNLTEINAFYNAKHT